MGYLPKYTKIYLKHPETPSQEVLSMEEIPNNHPGMDLNLVNDGINYLSLNWLAGFQPSTVGCPRNYTKKGY